VTVSLSEVLIVFVAYLLAQQNCLLSVKQVNIDLLILSLVSSTPLNSAECSKAVSKSGQWARLTMWLPMEDATVVD